MVMGEAEAGPGTFVAWLACPGSTPRREKIRGRALQDRPTLGRPMCIMTRRSTARDPSLLRGGRGEGFPTVAGEPLLSPVSHRPAASLFSSAERRQQQPRIGWNVAVQCWRAKRHPVAAALGLTCLIAACRLNHRSLGMPDAMTRYFWPGTGLIGRGTQRHADRVAFEANDGIG